MCVCVCVCVCACARAQSCPTLCHPMDCSPPGSFRLWNSPGKNTGVGCHALLQGIFSTQGSPASLALACGFFTSSACHLGSYVYIWLGSRICIHIHTHIHIYVYLGFPGGSDSKESACNAGDLGSIPGSGRFPGKRNGYPCQYSWGFPGGSDGKRTYLQCRRPGFDPWVRKMPWRRDWLTTPIFLPGEVHGQRSLAGYNPWCCKELDTTERLTLSFFSFIIFYHILF